MIYLDLSIPIFYEEKTNAVSHFTTCRVSRLERRDSALEFNFIARGLVQGVVFGHLQTSVTFLMATTHQCHPLTIVDSHASRQATSWVAVCSRKYKRSTEEVRVQVLPSHLPSPPHTYNRCHKTRPSGIPPGPREQLPLTVTDQHSAPRRGSGKEGRLLQALQTEVDVAA